MGKPNVIVFFTDQQRWDTSSLYGNNMDLTPNFDHMAQEGTHCYNAFTPQPVCLPARSCLQTGLYASELEIFSNGEELPANTKTLGHYFQEAGYNTGYIGKWHMCHEEPVPKKRREGYDYWLGSNVLEFTSDAYNTVMYNDDGEEIFVPGYRVDALTDKAVDYIQDNQNNPFFLFLSYLEPHFQNSRDDYPAPAGYEQKYQNPWTPPDLQALGGTSARHLPGYYGMVKRLDESLGRLNDALISMGLKEDTIIVYLSDHGCHFKTRNSEYKRSCHDSSIRIPMAINGPGFESGGRLKDMISLIDIPPTLLDACNINVPDNMKGKSIYKLVNQKNNEWKDCVFIEINNEGWMRRCVRTQRWKYSIKAATHFNENEGHPDKYIEEELYDLKADPWELNNLIGYESHQKVSEVMKERLLNKMRDLEDKEIEIEKAPGKPSGQKVVLDEELYE
ncbi:MAG: sulfatase-like hydrolase/transferase [Halanaerobiales bacterium]